MNRRWLGAFPLVLLVACSGTRTDPRDPRDGRGDGGVGDDQGHSEGQSGAQREYNTLREVDWDNFTFDLGYDDVYPMEGGQYGGAEDPHGDQTRAWLRPPVYGDIGRDGTEEAIVVVVVDPPSSAILASACVYSLHERRPRMVARIEGGDRAFGGLFDVAIAADGTVAVSRNQAAPGDLVCCPSLLRIETWEWNGEELAEDEDLRRTEPHPERDATPAGDQPPPAE